MTILSVQSNLGNKSNWKHQNAIGANIVSHIKMFILYLLYCFKRKHWNNCPRNCFFYCYWIPRVLTTERKGWYIVFFCWLLPVCTFTDDEYWLKFLLIKTGCICLMSQQPRLSMLRVLVSSREPWVFVRGGSALPGAQPWIILHLGEELFRYMRLGFGGQMWCAHI